MCFHISQHILTKVNFNKMEIYICIKVIGGLILDVSFMKVQLCPSVF